MLSNGNIVKELLRLYPEFQGDIFIDWQKRVLYATDASAYREIPLAVTRPKNIDDLKLLVMFAKKHNSTLIPRAAGTSLAGQVVGSGVVVDVGKYMNRVIEINEKEGWVTVQPGVVRDELNQLLEPYGLFFSPETSSSNRAMIGGMVGNNACGNHSLIYGSTRDHLISVKTILSDASEVEFSAVSKEEFAEKCKLKTLEGELYNSIHEILSDQKNQKKITSQFPHPSINRRNTGYALDLLLDTSTFTSADKPFNFSSLLAGSEGTLALITEIKLHLDPLSPKHKGLICIHCNSIEDALNGNLIALKYSPGAIELMDDVVMEQSKTNIYLRKNRFFIKDQPTAMLMVEFARDSKEEILSIASEMELEMKAAGYGYHFPVLFGDDISKAWEIRKAGLGLLSNIPGDAKPVPVVEDTAILPQMLPDYIAEFKLLLKKYKLDCVYYAHIATGELHLRPVLNLKDSKDVELFYTIALETAKLVKKYKGSLSGEHGDGRLRGEFLPIMIGEHNYQLLKQIKLRWDPERIFNQGKIVETPKMNTSLRYEPNQVTKEIKTWFNFDADKGYLRSVEKCNGSGDCIRPASMGGMMCPSYQASRNEDDSTRARANILREYITHSSKENPFDHKEIIYILDLCLSCKACKSECPSNVDMTKLKAEALQHYYKSNGIPLRTRVIANFHLLNSIGWLMPGFTNFILANQFTGGVIKKILKFAPARNLPKIAKFTLKAWIKSDEYKSKIKQPKGKVFLFADEFTNYNDVEIGITAIKLLSKLGYKVKIPDHTISGRAFLSKGILIKAKKIANKNVRLLKDIITDETPLIGIEPSAILSFRDEYPDLVDQRNLKDAENLAKSSFLIDEFICREIDKGNIMADQFVEDEKKILFHGHCHQKSLASSNTIKKMLSLPVNYKVEEIKSGCCGMAGSFGFEKEHYHLSMQIGEMKLFPEVRKTEKRTIIVASGTSCRQQIKDGTFRKARHPVEVLYEALRKK